MGNTLSSLPLSRPKGGHEGTGRVTVWAGPIGPLGVPLPAHTRPSPPDGPAVRTGHARSTWIARASQDCGFPHPRAGPKVSSQSSPSISFARYLNSIGSYTALVALAEKQQQALSHLERELVRAGFRRADRKGLLLLSWGWEREHPHHRTPGCLAPSRAAQGCMGSVQSWWGQCGALTPAASVQWPGLSEPHYGKTAAVCVSVGLLEGLAQLAVTPDLRGDLQLL